MLFLKNSKLVIILFAIIFLINIIFIYNQNCLAVGVKPLIHNIEIKPGETKEFELTLTPSEKAEKVLFKIFKPEQILDGNLKFVEPTSDNFPAIEWIKFEKEEVTTIPNEKKVIKGKVTAPFSAEGSHTAIMMVEPQTLKKMQGVSFKIRYAVKLNIRIDRPGSRNKAELEEGWGLTKGENGEPILETIISNTSLWDYKVSAEATIRDSRRKLVERINLRSAASNDKNQIRLYPESKVIHQGEITRRLTHGEEYTVRLFIKYGDHGQIIKSKKIKIAEGEYNFVAADKAGAVSVEPASIDLTLKPGQRKTNVINVKSEIGETSILAIKSTDINSEYKYSNKDWIEMRAKDQIVLEGRRTKRLVLTSIVPREIEPGSYHSNVEIHIYSKETEKLLEKEVIPYSVVVGTEHKPKVDIKSLHSTETEEGYLLSLDINNSGNIFLNPNAKIIINDENDEYVEKVELSMPEEVNRLLPLKSKLLTGISQSITPGKYNVTIIVENDDQEVGKSTKVLEID